MRRRLPPLAPCAFREAPEDERLADDGRLEVWCRSVAHGAPIMLYEGTRTVRA
jgi:hypothetical protein